MRLGTELNRSFLPKLAFFNLKVTVEQEAISEETRSAYELVLLESFNLWVSHCSNSASKLDVVVSIETKKL